MDSAKCPCEALIPKARIPSNSMCASKTCISMTRRAWEFPYNWSRCVPSSNQSPFTNSPTKSRKYFHSTLLICSSSLPRISNNNRSMISKMHPLNTRTPSFHCNLFLHKALALMLLLSKIISMFPTPTWLSHESWLPSYDHAFDIWTLHFQLILLSKTWYKIHDTKAVPLKVLHICWLSCRWSQIFGQVCQRWCNHYSSYFNAPAQADDR